MNHTETLALTTETVRKTMNKHLNESLNAHHGENVTTIFLGGFLECGITVFGAMVYGDSNEAINVTHEAPNGGKIKRVIMCNTASKRMMRKFLNDHIDVSDDEVIYIATKSLTSDGETVVKAVFAGNSRDYKLSSLDDAEVKSIHDVCNNIATTATVEVA